jgi:uncharacterized protein (DUF433 family)
MPGTIERRAERRRIITVNEAAFAAGVSLKTVNQAIDREHVRTVELKRSSDRARRGIDATDAVYLSVREVLAPPVRAKLYRFLRGKPLKKLPLQFEVERIILDLAPAVEEVTRRLEFLTHIEERVEVDPEVRGGEPVFRGTRVPVYGIARKLELGSTEEELQEDHPRLEKGDLAIARQYAKLYPRRGRPRRDRDRTDGHGAGVRA